VEDKGKEVADESAGEDRTAGDATESKRQTRSTMKRVLPDSQTSSTKKPRKA
jgi:hypothetical protein